MNEDLDETINALWEWYRRLSADDPARPTIGFDLGKRLLAKFYLGAGHLETGTARSICCRRPSQRAPFSLRTTTSPTPVPGCC